jgi:putative hydrolase of the HAD superfamily
VEAKLKASGLDQIAWDLGMDCEELGSLKPYPEAFHEAARRLGVEPGRVLYVGDREDTDVQGARAAGLKAVHVEHRTSRRTNSLAADLILFRTADLAEALGLV